MFHHMSMVLLIFLVFNPPLTTINHHYQLAFPPMLHLPGEPFVAPPWPWLRGSGEVRVSAPRGALSDLLAGRAPLDALLPPGRVGGGCRRGIKISYIPCIYIINMKLIEIIYIHMNMYKYMYIYIHMCL